MSITLKEAVKRWNEQIDKNLTVDYCRRNFKRAFSIPEVGSNVNKVYKVDLYKSNGRYSVDEGKFNEALADAKTIIESPAYKESKGQKL